MQPDAAPPRAPLGPRLFGLAILALALAVAATFLWPLLRPVRSVPMAAVRASSVAGQATNAIAEAAGWIEPDPFATLVRPLVAGRIDSIEVLEGAAVVKDETVVAHLASALLLAAQDRARAVAAERDRERAAAANQLEVAKAQLAQLAAPRAAEAEAQQQLAERQGKLATARGAHDRATAEAAGAHAALTAQERLAEAGGSYPVALARAKAAAEAADATAAATARELDAAAAELAAAESREHLASELLAAPVDLRGAVATAERALARADAALASASTDLQIAERELAWTTVRAPCSGIVMKLLAAPGARVGPEAEPILAIYDPAHLRARIDVPLGSIAGITDGQDVELRSEVLGSTTVRGVVQRVQRESDLLKNTLQVKVGLIDPPPLLRPETLCRARFLGAPTGENAAASALTFVVPKAAVRDGRVFRFDPAARRARAVAVRIVQEQGDDVVVQGDLSLAQRVVLAAVADGEAVQEERR